MKKGGSNVNMYQNIMLQLYTSADKLYGMFNPTSGAIYLMAPVKPVILYRPSGVRSSSSSSFASPKSNNLRTPSSLKPMLSVFCVACICVYKCE